MKGKRSLKNHVIFLFIVFLIYSCIALPKTVSKEEQDCFLVTKSMTIDFYTSPELMDEAVDEMINAISSDCHKPECLLLFAPLIAISAGSLVVSGSIVIVGNTIHWMEEQGRCDDSVTQQTLASLKNPLQRLGGKVIHTGNELIEWFKRQVSNGKNPIVTLPRKSEH